MGEQMTTTTLSTLKYSAKNAMNGEMYCESTRKKETEMKEDSVEDLKKRIADLEQRDKRLTAELHEFIMAEDVMVAARLVTKEQVKQAHDIVQLGN